MSAHAQRGVSARSARRRRRGAHAPDVCSMHTAKGDAGVAGHCKARLCEKRSAAHAPPPSSGYGPAGLAQRACTHANCGALASVLYIHVAQQHRLWLHEYLPPPGRTPSKHGWLPRACALCPAAADLSTCIRMLHVCAAAGPCADCTTHARMHEVFCLWELAWRGGRGLGCWRGVH